MTSTQKFSGLSIVPWYNSAEWKHVYKLIFGPNSNEERKQEAIDIIMMWQIRCSLLPSGVEGTLSVLEAMLAKESDLSHRQYCTILSSSLMRFLNICVAKRSNANTFTWTAKSYNIPDWIIDLRHQIAHGQRLPSISILKLALNECFKWLNETYWLAEMRLINDHYITKKSIGLSDNTDYLVMYCNLMYCHFNDVELSDEICDELVAKKFNPMKLSLQTIMDGIYDVLKGSLLEMDKEFVLFVVRSLIDGNCFYTLPGELLTNDIKKYEMIQNIITILYENKALLYLIDELAIIINNQDESDTSRESVSLWLNEIFKGLSIHKDVSNIHSIKGNGIVFKTVDQTIIDELINHQHIIFNDINKFTKLCFDSFVLLSAGRLSKKENDEYLKSYEKAMNNKYNKKIFDEIDDCADLGSQICLFINLDFSNRFNNDVDMDVNDVSVLNGDDDLNVICNLVKSTRKRKWIREKRTHLLETYPLGILPADF